MKFADILRRRNKVAARQARIEAIQKMGMKLIDGKGWHDGKYYAKRYILELSNGQTLDNSGAGFKSTYSAHQAALAEFRRNQTA